MISGDNIHTAIDAARKAGILKDGEDKVDKVCMLGKDFREQVGGVKKTVTKDGVEKWELENKPNFKAIAQRLKVLARSTPEDKFALIVGLKDVGACVAVTADGINDAAALRHANVGFCMGISGCEVAKDASDIIILDDNFTSVFKAANWGRSVYDNIRKFIQFQLTVSIVTLALVFIGRATLGESPFNIIQLLWINMVMDTLAAMALATEPPHPTELKADKVKKHDKLITPCMWRTIFGHAIYQFLVMIVLMYFGPMMFGLEYSLVAPTFKPTADDIPTAHYTLLFHTFMMMNFFNQINCRKLGAKEFNVFKNFFNNFWFIVILAGQFIG